MILMICACFPPEPVVAATLTHDLANELASGRRVVVLTPKPTRPCGFIFEDTPISKSFEQVVVPSYTCSCSSLWGRMKESFSFGWHASRYIRKNKATIQSVYICTWPLFAPFQILRTARRYAIPSILHVEDIYPEALSTRYPAFGNLIRYLFMPFDASILRMASKVIAVSENMKKCFVETRRIPHSKVSLIYNWQDEREFISFEQFNNNELKISPLFTFMYLGNIGPLAGIDFIIECFHRAKLHDARLIIAGAGSMKNKCCEQACRCNDANIHFWDVPAGKVPEIQSYADVMFLPVKRNGAMSSIPSKLPAYMFSRKPVIAGVDAGSDTAETVNRAQCGWVIAPENMDEWIQIFQKVIAMPKAELKKLGNNGYNFAIENFSRKRNLQKMIDLFAETEREVLDAKEALASC